MAKDVYQTGVSPHSILRVDEEEQGLVPSVMPNGELAVKKRRRDRFNGNGRDKLTMAEMKVSMTAFWKEGDTYVEIAAKVNKEFDLEGDMRIGASNVQYHVTSLLKSARKLALAHITERQALILARYEQIEWLATEAYFASMQSVTTNYEQMIKQARTKDREKQLLEDLKRERARVDELNVVRKKNHKPLLRADEPDPVVGDFPDILKKTHKNIKKYKRVEHKPAGDPRFLAMLIDITDKKAKLFGLLNRTDNSSPDQELARLTDEERTSRLSAVIHAALSRKTGDKGTLAPPSPLGGFPEDPLPAPDETEVPDLDELEDESDADSTPEVDWNFDE